MPSQSYNNSYSSTGSASSRHSNGSAHPTYGSAFSSNNASRQSQKTDITNYSSTDNDTALKRVSAAISSSIDFKTESSVDEDLPRSSVETYASTIASKEELVRTESAEIPPERNQCFVADAEPSHPSNFADLFPSARRLLIQHDDSTPDGNMNLRLDTEVMTRSGRRKKMTLFHLRMKDLAERQFSLRRYCRDSGREVVAAKRKYLKPSQVPTQSKRLSLQRPLSSALSTLHLQRRKDSGYESDEDDEDDDTIEAMAAEAGVKATVPTSNMHLEFSNYAQVTVEPQKSHRGIEYGFEYWGDVYSWKRETRRDGNELFYSYHLINVSTGKQVAMIMPDALSKAETDFEASQGGWIPACSMRLLNPKVSADLGDVIVSTGLVALTDDCTRRRFPQESKQRC